MKNQIKQQPSHSQPPPPSNNKVLGGRKRMKKSKNCCPSISRESPDMYSFTIFLKQSLLCGVKCWDWFWLLGTHPVSFQKGKSSFHSRHCYFLAKITEVCLSHSQIHITPGRKEYPQDLLSASGNYCNINQKGHFSHRVATKTHKNADSSDSGAM